MTIESSTQRRKQPTRGDRRTATARTLTRASLKEAVYSACLSLSRAEAGDILDATLEEISQALEKGEFVKLASFGTFKIQTKRERPGRNPKTGVETVITARRVLRFKPSALLVSRVNEGAGKRPRAARGAAAKRQATPQSQG